MKPSSRTTLAAAYAVLCVVLGGASAAGILANLALQLLAAILLAIVALRERERGVPPAERWLWRLAAALAALILIQLIPLPPSAWTSLPGRNRIVEGFELLAEPLPWLAVSLTPDGTIRALVALLPPLALVALVVPMSARSRGIFLPLIIGIAFAALLLGLVQIAGSPHSPLYFYAVTNPGHTVGFFANRNHQATLLLMALPFVAALATPLLEGGRIREGGGPKIVIIAALFAMLAGGVLATASRAGIALLPMVGGLCVLMVRKDLTGSVPPRWVAVSAILLVGGMTAVAISGVVTRDALAAGPIAQSTRESIWRNTAREAAAFQPAGSGLGSFLQIYQMQEDPLDRPDEYANHAHNDYLEWLLETGIAGLALLLAFLAWFSLGVRRVWTEREAALGRAGSIAIGAVMLHSTVDYPVRTAAISALCALCLALMIAPPDQSPEAPPR
ncbi:MAG TPA: O-antigen ligase family protein [Allosphingosinicella sp.]|nr:O-antigen ligase family protein [Allosphingosinicella sp.]